MRDAACIEFLRWCLPKLGMRWEGYRKVRKQVCKRIGRRMRELDIHGGSEYRAYLDDRPEEWGELDRMCRIKVSRFYRDRRVYQALADRVLPRLAECSRQHDVREVSCWSAGCAAREEPYTLKILWEEAVHPRFPGVDLHIIATDAEPNMLERARRGRFGHGSVKELPAEWLDVAFHRDEHEEPYRLKDRYRKGITWRRQDIRERMPRGPFDLVLCRNLVFTYFDRVLQRACLERLTDRVREDGFLVLGKQERLPSDGHAFRAWNENERIYRRD